MHLDFYYSFIHYFHDSIVLSLGSLLLAGFFFGRLFQLLKLPFITGYIVAGLLLGESVFGLVHEEMSVNLAPITEVALGLIALTIGSEFSIHKLRRTGTAILILTLFEALFAFIFVSTALILFKVNVNMALILGSISAATAPAATVVIIKELRARGDFIDYLYGIVAFDDAICVILFGIVFAAVSPALSGAVESVSVLSAFAHALAEVFFSFLLGLAGGVLLHIWTIRKVKVNEILLISISLLFIVTALAESLHLSALLANMAMGAALVNFSSKNKRIFTYLEPMTPPIFALFFILAGTELSIHVFMHGTIILLGAIYLISRFLGKATGINIAGLLTKTPARIRKNIGFCLFPQAGVAIGLALFVQSSPVSIAAPPESKALFELIVNIVLFSVFVNELVGPSISRFGIKKGMDL